MYRYLSTASVVQWSFKFSLVQFICICLHVKIYWGMYSVTFIRKNLFQSLHPSTPIGPGSWGQFLLLTTESNALYGLKHSVWNTTSSITLPEYCLFFSGFFLNPSDQCQEIILHHAIGLFCQLILQNTFPSCDSPCNQYYHDYWQFRQCGETETINITYHHDEKNWSHCNLHEYLTFHSHLNFVTL